MHEKERHNVILSAVQERPVATVADFCALTGASEATVRRDINTLHAQKRLRRVRGGAEAITPPQFVGLAGRTFAVNETIRGPEKQAIARAAVELCNDGDAIIINGGTTTFQMVHPLAMRRMQVFTNSFPIAEHLLKNSKNTVMLSGGVIYREQNIILSPFDNDLTRNFAASRMFMGAQGLGPLGLMEADPLLIQAETKLIEQADQLVVLVDSSKFESRSSLVLCPLTRIDVVVTDELTDHGLILLASTLHLRLKPLAGDSQGILPDAFAAACAAGEVKALFTIPSLNHPAFLAATRTSPIDGVNFNRAFPGDPRGTLSLKLAAFVNDHLIPEADVVLDFHSGGKTLDFLPMAVSHILDDPEQDARCATAARAFSAPWTARLREIDDTGMLDGAAERAGKTFVTTELGGGGTATARSAGIAHAGLTRLLAFHGIYRADYTPAPSRALDLSDPAGFHFATHRGLFHPQADLGDTVEEGQTLAHIYHPEDLEAAPKQIRAARPGLLAARHVPGLIQPGDCAFVIGTDDGPLDLL